MPAETPDATSSLPWRQRWYQTGRGKKLKGANLFREFVEQRNMHILKRGAAASVVFAFSVIISLSVLYVQQMEKDLPNVRVTHETNSDLERPDISTYLKLKSMVEDSSNLENLVCPCGGESLGTVVTNNTMETGREYFVMDTDCDKGYADFALVKHFPAVYKPHLLRTHPDFYEQFEARYNGTIRWDRATDFISEDEFLRRTVTERRKLDISRLCRAIRSLINSNAAAYLKRVLTSPTLLEKDMVVTVLRSRFAHMKDLSLAAINLAYEKDTFRLDFEGIESQWGQQLNRYLDSVHAPDIAAMTEGYAGFMHKMLTGKTPAFNPFRATPIFSQLKNVENYTWQPPSVEPVDASEVANAACFQGCSNFTPGNTTKCSYFRYLMHSCPHSCWPCSTGADSAQQACPLQVDAPHKMIASWGGGDGTRGGQAHHAIRSACPAAQDQRSDARIAQSGVAASVSRDVDSVTIATINGRPPPLTHCRHRL